MTVRRIALAGSRAGLLPVLAGGLGDASLCAEGIAVELGAGGEAGSPGCRRIIVCPTNVIVQARWLRALAESSVEPETLSLDPSITLILIEHDMDVALRVAEWVTMMHDGKVIVEGTPAEIRANELVHDLYLGSAHH